MMIDPNAPAYPAKTWKQFELDGIPVIGDWREHLHPGLTIRAEIASRLMAGMMSDPERYGDIHEFAKWGIEGADALIKALNKTSKS